MNKTLNTLLGAMLLAGSASAFAASSVDLTVTGTITPSACSLSLSQGEVDYETISAKDLLRDSETQLDPKQVQLLVSCDAPTLMALESKDNRAGSAYHPDPIVFGLGLVNSTEKLGSLFLDLSGAIADGQPVRTINSSDNGASWALKSTISRDGLMSVADNTTVAPVAFQEMSVNLDLDTYIAPANGLTLTNDVNIDGSVTLTVRYL